MRFEAISDTGQRPISWPFGAYIGGRGAISSPLGTYRGSWRAISGRLGPIQEVGGLSLGLCELYRGSQAYFWAFRSLCSRPFGLLKPKGLFES